MEDYQAKYYDEALLHYGVKGMKWGVRKASRAVKNNIKASGRTTANSLRHPIETQKARVRFNKGAPLKTKLRRNMVGYTTKELNAFNKDVAKSVSASKKMKRKKKVAKLDKKINSLKEQQKKREKRLGEQLAKRGYAPINKYTDPRVTAKAITKKQIQRDSVKRGDSRRVTRLKLQKNHLQSQINSFNKRLATPEGVTLRELKAYQNNWSTLERINKDINKAQKKKKR